MKLERNLFFRGHRKIVFFFNRGEVGWGCGQGEGGGESGWNFTRVSARCSQTDKQGQIDRQVGGVKEECERREEEEGETVCFVMSE